MFIVSLNVGSNLENLNQFSSRYTCTLQLSFFLMGIDFLWSSSKAWSLKWFLLHNPMCNSNHTPDMIFHTSSLLTWRFYWAKGTEKKSESTGIGQPSRKQSTDVQFWNDNYWTIKLFYRKITKSKRSIVPKLFI